jgi:hypothetical protein
LCVRKMSGPAICALIIGIHVDDRLVRGLE